MTSYLACAPQGQHRNAQVSPLEGIHSSRKVAGDSSCNYAGNASHRFLKLLRFHLGLSTANWISVGQLSRSSRYSSRKPQISHGGASTLNSLASRARGDIYAFPFLYTYICIYIYMYIYLFICRERERPTAYNTSHGAPRSALHWVAVRELDLDRKPLGSL